MEECKTAGSPFWSPFCSLLDTSDYTEFARMLQENACLCCGEQFVAYTPDQLVTMFKDFMRQHAAFHAQLRDFQLRERHRFMWAEEQTTLGEHRLEWTHSHCQFVDLIEAHMKEFTKVARITDQEFANAIRIST